MAVAANYVVVMDGKKRLKSGNSFNVQYRTTLQPTGPPYSLSWWIQSDRWTNSSFKWIYFHPPVGWSPFIKPHIPAAIIIVCRKCYQQIF